MENAIQTYSWTPNIEHLRKLHLEASLLCSEIPETSRYPKVAVAKVDPFSLLDHIGMIVTQNKKYSNSEYSYFSENFSANITTSNSPQENGNKYYNSLPQNEENNSVHMKGGLKRKLLGCSRLKNSSVLEDWFYSHQDHPYPTKEEKERLAKEANLTLNQVSNFFINFRRRYRKENGLQNKKKTKFICHLQPGEKKIEDNQNF